MHPQHSFAFVLEVKRLREEWIDLIVLSGYMRKLPESVVALYRGRILNIHPALLPDFGGCLVQGIQRGVQRTAMGGKVEAIKVTMGIYEHMGPGYIVWVGRSDLRVPARWVSI